MGASDAPRPAREAGVPALLELVQHLRRALLARGEFLGPAWVEEAARDLHGGHLVGWVAGPPAAPTGVAFYSLRPQRAYGHVHVEPGPSAVSDAQALALALISALPESALRMDIGTTGLTPEEEGRLTERLATRPGLTSLRRYALERSVRPEDPAAPVAVPAGFFLRRIRELPMDALARLDWAAFRGTPDESLVADSVEEDRRILEEIVRGDLGRFLEEASTGLVDDEGRFAAFLLTAEQTPHRAVFLDLVVHPEMRGRGLARFLLAWSMRALFALGHEEVRLWVTAANAPARRLYEATGFLPVLEATIYRYDRAAAPPQPQPGA